MSAIFAAMELRRSDRERGSFLPLMSICVAFCAFRLEKVDNRPPDTFSALFGAIWRKRSPTLSAGSA